VQPLPVGPSRRTLRRLGAGLLFVIFAAGCGGGATDPAAAALAALPACDEAAEHLPAPSDVAGLVLPEGSRVTEVTRGGPVVTVSAEVSRTPVDVRNEYHDRDDLEVLSAEDETFESEVLVRVGDHRMYLRAVALCAQGSGLTAVIGPDSDDTTLPELRTGR
ncbi:MAG: hypothetical protein ABGZ36_03120, partial [Actinomycetota bacterium]